MTADEHLAEAERLLDLSERTTGGDWPMFTEDPEDRAELRDRARTHAAIAQAQVVVVQPDAGPPNCGPGCLA